MRSLGLTRPPSGLFQLNTTFSGRETTLPTSTDVHVGYGMDPRFTLTGAVNGFGPPSDQSFATTLSLSRWRPTSISAVGWGLGSTPNFLGDLTALDATISAAPRTQLRCLVGICRINRVCLRDDQGVSEVLGLGCDPLKIGCLTASENHPGESCRCATFGLPGCRTSGIASCPQQAIVGQIPYLTAALRCLLCQRARRRLSVPVESLLDSCGRLLAGTSIYSTLPVPPFAQFSASRRQTGR